MKPRTHPLTLSLGRPVAVLAGLAVVAAPAVSQTIAITEFLNNPSGIDDGFEFVELFNYGASAVDLTGWTISDEDNDSFTIPSLSLNSGDYAVFVGPGFSGGGFADSNAIVTGFTDEFFGGTAPAGANIIPMFTTNPGATSFPTLSNGGDELILRNGLSVQDVNAAGSGTVGDVVWSLAYPENEPNGQSTFLATDSFTRSVTGSQDAPAVNFFGTDFGGTGLGYISNGADIVDGIVGEVTIYDTALTGGVTADNAPPAPATSVSGSTASPLDGFYTTNGTGVGPLDGFITPISATVGFGTGGDNAGTLDSGATTTSTQNVKLVISAIADPSNFEARVIELTALEAVSESELAQYGLNTASNGADESNRVETPIAKAGGLAAGESIYVVNVAGSFRDYFADVDGGGTATPFPADGIVSEGSPAIFFNGDDAIQLTLNGVEVDRYGVVGVDGTGEDWEYTDGYVDRNDGVGPSTTFSAADFSILEEEFDGFDASGQTIGILPPQVGPFDGLTGGTPNVQRNADLENARLALMNFDGAAIDTNGDLITDPANVILINDGVGTDVFPFADRTPQELGTYDSLGTTGPSVETPVAGEYVFDEVILTSPTAAGFVSITGTVPQDTIFVGLDIETPAGSPELADLFQTLTDNGVVFTDNSAGSSEVLAGYTDNPLYDDYEVIVEVGQTEDGDFDLNWNFTFDADPAFSANPLVAAVAFGTIEATGFLTGDYNGDGFVSQADLDLVLLNWGESALPAGWAAVDQFDGELISQNELDGVLLNWGNGTPPVNAIPEPTSLALLGLGGLGLVARRRRSA